ncbi:MAG: hypothetical protein IJI51_03555 [Lachnospiraceae bacterium]|nr:hypothetical protein [Lachnospiraceae bacterium]
MGWDYSFATHYKNGRIDRKAECDDRLTRPGIQKVLKSSLVGSVYYAAVEITNEDKAPFVLGAVILTAIDGRNIGMKIIEETCGPCEDQCPIGILKLLSPTDSEWANRWRERCYKYHEDQKRQRKDKYSLKNLPVGSVIDFVCKHDNSAYKAGQPITLTKRVVSWKYRYDARKGEHVRKETVKWSDGYYTWPERMIPDDYRVLLEHTIVDAQSRKMIYEGKWAS